MIRYVVVLHIATDRKVDPTGWPWDKWTESALCRVDNVATFFENELPADVHITQREIYEHE